MTNYVNRNDFGEIVSVDDRGTIMFENEQGQLHREDGPVSVRCDGQKRRLLHDIEVADKDVYVTELGLNLLFSKDEISVNEDCVAACDAPTSDKTSVTNGYRIRKIIMLDA